MRLLHMTPDDAAGPLNIHQPTRRRCHPCSEAAQRGARKYMTTTETAMFDTFASVMRMECLKAGLPALLSVGLVVRDLLLKLLRGDPVLGASAVVEGHTREVVLDHRLVFLNLPLLLLREVLIQVERRDLAPC